MAGWIRAEQRDTRAPDRVVEDLIQLKRISGIAVYPFAPGIWLGRRQAHPALQLTSQHQDHHPASLVTARAPRSGAYGFDYTERRPPSGILSAFSPGILPPAGKNRPLKFKEAAFHGASRAFRLVDDAPRSGAYRFEYMEIIPASGTSSTFALGILPPAGKSCPLDSKRCYLAIMSYVAGRRRREAAPMLRFSHFQYPPSRIPDIFGNSIFRRPASKARNEANLSSPRAALFRSSKSKIKIKNLIFRRPPSADFVRVPANLNSDNNGFQAELVSRAQVLRKSNVFIVSIY
ncbi:hypothetical protein R3P38DRAFT_2793123 [Favolaschia claudopus]|uniref:Uncharacterized protein n=1 Tax=Favolaschia claudopus TaxID=2862362 RepID=A0AAW0ADM9_9AGAR